MLYCVFLAVLIVILSTYLTSSYFFFFNDTATTEIYTLSLHDALPILPLPEGLEPGLSDEAFFEPSNNTYPFGCHISMVDRKSTRLNSSHVSISYAVFCLKKKKKKKKNR